MSIVGVTEINDGKEGDYTIILRLLTFNTRRKLMKMKYVVVLAKDSQNKMDDVADYDVVEHGIESVKPRTYANTVCEVMR